MSVFDCATPAPPIEVFQLGREFAADTAAEKVSLGVGAYRTDEGKPWILPCVKKAESILATQVEEEKINHEYLPVLGLDGFTKAATKMLLGEDSPALAENRAFGIQCLSGTGSLRIGAEFLKRIMGCDTVYISAPTWGNHNLLFKYTGYSQIRTYRYWDADKKGMDWDGLCEDLGAAPAKSVIILHACAHNPTGLDPTREQWEKIAQICRANQLFPFFDCAYQGFASGCLDTDAWAVRYFVSQGFELFCSQSFSKNFGLYNERTGNLTVVTGKAENLENIKSQMTLIVRAMVSNPPAHGARIVETVLSDASLYEEWRDCIRTMSSRIIAMRASLRQKLEELGTPGDWSHITTQIGMFSYTGLSQEMCVFLKQEKHLYLLKSGRISMCGLTTKNVDYVAKAINEAVTKFQ